jgi:tetratricopeptide (TPR) repeat protein
VIARRSFALAALALLLAAAARAQNPADAAWARGDMDTARRLYAERLAADSSDVRALHRMGLLLSWDGRYAAGIALLDRLLLAAPQNGDARVDRARVLAWAQRFDESIAGYVEALRRASGDRQALLGLAQTLAWMDRLDSARAIYARVLAANPTDLEARQGAARVLGWDGRLVAAEAQWRAALELDTTNAASLAGLSQTLRWQGRLAAAREVLARIPAEGRTARDYREERRQVDAALRTTGAPAVTYEMDSDGNRIATLSLRARRALRPRLQASGDFYLRTASYHAAFPGSRQAWGVMGTGRYLFEPGWVVGAGLGVSGADGAGSANEPALLLSASTPARYRVGGSLTLLRTAFDATALIIERGVTMTERSLGLRFSPAPRWNLDGSASWTTFYGTESNRRIAGYLSGTRTLAPAWAAVASVRSFGYAKNLQDGYFDPDFFLLSELTVRWRPMRGRWEVSTEVAPGIQQVGRGGESQATIRVAARGTWEPALGRQVGASAVYTNAGLQSFATGQSGYRYVALTLSGSWAF